MLRNLNDYLSLIALVVAAYYGVKFFVGSFVSTYTENSTISTRRALLKDYINNEDD